MNTSSLQKNENGRAYVMFAESNPTKMRISPIKLQGRVVVPRMVATSETNVQLAFLNDQAKHLKPNELVRVSLAPCHSLNQGCKRF